MISLFAFISGLFTNIVARWPGSTHDSFMFRSSNLCSYIEENHHSLDDGILLGDSGYALRPFMMTPYINPSTPAQVAYDDAHCKTRVIKNKLLAAGNVAFMFSILKFVWLQKKCASSLVHVLFCTISQFSSVSQWRMEMLVGKQMRIMCTVVLIKDKLSEIILLKPISARCHPFDQMYHK